MALCTLIRNFMAFATVLTEALNNASLTEGVTPPLEPSTVELIRKFVVLSTEYMKAAAAGKKTDMDYFVKRLTEVAKLFTPEIVKQIPPKARSEMMARNKILRDITKTFLK